MYKQCLQDLFSHTYFLSVIKCTIAFTIFLTFIFNTDIFAASKPDYFSNLDVTQASQVKKTEKAIRNVIKDRTRKTPTKKTHADIAKAKLTIREIKGTNDSYTSTGDILRSVYLSQLRAACSKSESKQALKVFRTYIIFSKNKKLANHWKTNIKPLAKIIAKQHKTTMSKIMIFSKPFTHKVLPFPGAAPDELDNKNLTSDVRFTDAYYTKVHRAHLVAAVKKAGKGYHGKLRKLLAIKHPNKEQQAEIDNATTDDGYPEDWIMGPWQKP